MARIALAGFLHETNTFSPIPTDYESFAARGAMLSGIYIAEELEQVFRGQNYNNSICGFYNQAEKLGHDVSAIAKIGEAEPSAPMPAKLFQQFLDLITDGITSAIKEKGPFDAVYLDLHGAMVYQPANQGETETIKQVRKVVGNVPIVVSLDLHGNISPEFFECASVLVGYRTYPHIDIYETGVRCATAMDYLLKRKPLYKAYHQLPFLMPGSTLATNKRPSQILYGEIDRIEQDPQVISASVMQGFLESDVPYMGPTVFAYASTQVAAQRAADRLLETALELEGEFRGELPNAQQAVAQAIEIAKTVDKPVILADGQDNPGGGAGSDTVWIMDELVKQGAPESAVALMFDPEAAMMAHQAGEGTVIEMDLGGKLTPGHNPFHGKFEVVKLSEGDFVCTGPMLREMKANLGKMAHLRIGDVHVVVASYRIQIFDQSFMRVVDLDPSKMKILVLKSTNHYRADFEPLCSTIIDVDAPSSLINNPETHDYQNLRDGLRLQGKGRVYKRPVA
ncbi:MAG: M81 family metallopeptidase [Chloroflexi bacterium]|nr:M81 family metallopeptidase [Chloroflexota bacterium]